MKVKEGKCFYCSSIIYSRDDMDMIDDTILFTCQCFDCGKTFYETFGLIETKGGDNYEG